MARRIFLEKYAEKDEDGNTLEDETWPPGKSWFVQDVMFMIHPKKDDPNTSTNQATQAYHLAEFTSRSAKVVTFL